MLLQELWSVKIGWDEPVPGDLVNKWTEFANQLPDLQRLEIPRWIGITETNNVQMHGFSDASQSGMAAVVYLRALVGDQVRITLVCAKTKVAPLKRMTIPRLELSAATLLARLTAHSCKTLELNNVPIFLWTDSSIVHTWINNHPSKWKEYVHNRVCLIQETLPQAQWKLVPGYDNPADCASRGLSPVELSTHCLWWDGPPWLRSDSQHWPGDAHETPQDDVLEIRPTASVNVVQSPADQHWDLINQYSSLTRLLRITAICQRIVKKFRRLFNGPITVPLTPEELLEAKHFWVQQVQTVAFKNEVLIISNKQTLPKQSHLIRLTPFLDQTGLLRVGGRLNNSVLSYANKHPLILPRQSPLSTLIISDAHDRTFHGSVQSTLSFIRTTCWILGGRAPVRTFILHCVKCSIFRQKNVQQLMGQLPATRVTPAERPFLNSGIDYAGPFMLKSWSGRAAKTYKGYVALFICQATSAMHLEIVTDYTSAAFLAAYQRFTSRRGICETLASDCGTNLKGADMELKRLFSDTSLELKKFATLIANDGTKWLFNPPAAPHFGEKWEAGVKSVKYHLRRTISDTVVTYEEMATLLAQIEAILNSRPLCTLTDDPDDLSVLTPGHFLIGQPLSVLPEPTLMNLNINRLDRWQRLRRMMETFWTKWSRECIQRYQTTYKWNQPSNSISPGTIVLIKDERYPPSKWPLGRVVSVYHGGDGLIRVATIKTQTTTLTRPIIKLCPLPIPTDEE